MNVILFDDHGRTNLLPLTFTRPCSELKVGIQTITEKWQRTLSLNVSFITQDYLSAKYPTKFSKDNLYINGRVLPNENLITQIKKLSIGECLMNDKEIIAIRSNHQFKNYKELQETNLTTNSSEVDCTKIAFVYDIFKFNGSEIIQDYAQLTKGKTSYKLSSTNTVIGDEIFIEEGVNAEAAVFNCTHGPIYLGKGSTVMEGSLIKGPFSLGEYSTVKMGAKIYGDTSIGPNCKVGGEISNSVFLKNSNKGHDGFLGNSVIGEWCNLGADTNSSNLKNNYANVKLWNYNKQRFIDTGLQFCGLIMGDHSKCGINTMFNTGTIVGVSANIFGSNFPRNYIPSFTWGGSAGFATYQTDKAFQTAIKVLERRNIIFTEIDKNMLKTIFEETAQYRFWEKN